ncbi:HAMP domain-containing protein [Nonomuraea sp. KC401]|uniref:sensor histidine kinase n=1 Tax=unclassified Nonomuraea TaxID=2593643 RepID=UPI0010FDB1AA|nr:MULTISPECIES: nitrate- and nitrite sensing domain-containing protein [unclassified Nonomuraea]NBE99147.1 HAMP domain-containing protein [Nonomuraea sp. K271]TLF57901.1 HAMP domain-containing protein [Nonomuraea sp. KC401]
MSEPDGADAVVNRRAGSRFSLRNWRVRSKLLVLVVIPTLAALVFGGLRVTTSIATAGEYAQVNEVAVLASRLTALAHEVERERDLTARYVAGGRRGVEKVPEDVAAQYENVDKLVTEVKPGVEALVNTDNSAAPDALRISNRFNELATSRETAISSQLDVNSVIELYDRTISDFLSLNDKIDQGAVDKELSASVSGFAALARAKQYVSTQRALLVAALARGEFGKTELDAFIAARAQRNSELATFKSQVSLQLRQAYDDTVSGRAVDRAEVLLARALLLQDDGLPLRDRRLGLARDGKAWFDAISETIDGMRSVEQQTADSIVLRSRTLEGAEQQNAVIVGGAIAALLLLVLLVTVFMARSLSGPLRRLRREALFIAGRRLPETVQKLRESGEGSIGAVSPIGVASNDEIGEVARAFDEVHREAVRLAGEEARLRSNVNAMFVNLSRRSQTLVERQITLIDGLEQGEQDEQRLGNLFKLDHLATRMRRNSENLLVLAGQDPPRRWSKPVKLVDVARASLSEVENYERVVLQVPDGVSVAGQAVNDVIHLIAELVENALSFSPRETRVTVSGSRIDGGGVMLSITDSGIGMTADELAQANERLMDAPTVDVSVSRRMGLFVVARLAHRHGIRVQLRPHGSGGLTAMVLMPESLLGTQAPSYGPASANNGMGQQERSYDEGFGARQPAAQPPVPQWGSGGGYQPGPGHPSFPSEPSFPSQPSFSSQPSSFSPRGSMDSGWSSDPRNNGGGYDTADVWVPSRNPASPPGNWMSNSNPLPQRPTADRANAGRPDPDAGRYDFPETESAATGPIPVVKPASAGDEYLPIFASVESAWFEHGPDSGATWGSAKADAGWSAAEAVVEPVRDGATAAGLPKRVPKANLVPGSADTVSAPKGVAPMPAVSPDRVRSRLSSFQQGFRAARDDISEGRTYPSGPRSVESRDERS